MQKKKNKQVKKGLFANPFMVIIALVIVAAGLFTISLITDNIERRAFYSLKSDLVDLQTQFNRIDKGWEYDESCRAKGGVYENDIPSSCAASISNKSVDFSTNQKERVEAYSEIINNSSPFTLKEDVVKYGSSSYFAVYDYPKIHEPNCTLQSFSDKDLASNKVSLTFGCIAESSKFYFERND